MTPFEQVQALYARWPQPRTFAADLYAHFETGYVAATPEFFIMGRGVDRYADPEDIADPWHAFLRSRQNCWLVYAFAGSRQNFLSFLPYRLDWTCFQRRGKPLRFYSFEKICNSIARSKSIA